MRWHAWLLLALALAGCAAGPASPSTATAPHDCATPLPPPTGGSDAPHADAGYDYAAKPGDWLFLDGSNSSDPHGGALTFHWSQTAGPCAALDLRDPAKPVLQVPASARRGDVLAFRLEVEAGGRASAPDDVQVHVE